MGLEDNSASAVPVDPRYAIYWVPPADHPLWRAGCAWLGRDPERPGDTTDATPVAHHRGQPRRYGFHATLKPPLRLRDGVDVDRWMDAIGRLAEGLAPFRMPALGVATLGRFIALRPRDPDEVVATHPLRRLADACVRELDDFRAPPDDTERARRASDPALDERARRRLERWGYPWVFDAWRFHMTLSDDLPDDASGHATRDRLLAEARTAFREALACPLAADGLALFVEDAPGRPFRLARRLPFGR